MIDKHYKDVWTEAEDELLIELYVRQHVRSWVKLEPLMREHGFNRNANACRARWNVLRKMFEPNHPSEVELLARHRPWRKAA